MKHQYKIEDATKEELIQYFFGVEGFGGGYRIPADKDRFLIWLERKRTDTLLDAQETATEAAQKSLERYIQYIKEANDEKDIEKKLALFRKANAAYKKFEEFNRQYTLLDKKITRSLGLDHKEDNR